MDSPNDFVRFRWERHVMNDHPELSPTARHVALTLATYTDKGGTCWASQPTLAKATGYSAVTVNRAVRDLKRAAVLYVTKRQNTSAVYRLAFAAHTAGPFTGDVSGPFTSEDLTLGGPDGPARSLDVVSGRHRTRRPDDVDVTCNDCGEHDGIARPGEHFGTHRCASCAVIMRERLARSTGLTERRTA